MKRISRWRRAMIFSLMFHVIIWTSIGIFAFARPLTPPQEDLLEMVLVDDINKLPGEAGGNSGNQAASLPQISIPKVSPVQPIVSEAEFDEEITRQPVAVPAVAPLAKRAMAEASAPTQTPGANATDTGNGSDQGTAGEGEGNGGNGDGSGSGDGDGGAVSPPAVLSAVKPTYPNRARQNGVEGTVLLRVEIRENGRSGAAEIESSSGDASLDDAALRVINKWRFVPAKQANGDSIACYTRVPIVFRITD